MTRRLAQGGLDGVGKLPSHPAQATTEGLLTAPHSVDTPLGWGVRGAGDSKETEEEASGVPQVLEAGPTPGTSPASGAEPTTEGSLFGSPPRGKSAWLLNNLQYLARVWEEVFRSTEDGAGIGLPKLGERILVFFFFEAKVLSRLGSTRVRRSIYVASTFKLGCVSTSRRVFLLVQGLSIHLFPRLASHILH
ncbi:hypothetical protein B296_00051934 [Ensete ventricosum]|uniref:Uncharacterized protein n=1 Tax=Ensete ventricosum TaxID=4639 RepID=A0A426Y6H5_ENSVE|nr:hypothetical protein B296_00051934 [Ensete ventricosum]